MIVKIILRNNNFFGILCMDKKNKSVRDDAPPPHCCGKSMLREKLPPCTIAQHPEMVRNEYDDEPCDDDRAYE